jgi:AraC-like DNA-binding protein
MHLCRAVLLSRTQLHKKLKALTGQSASLFIRQIRLYAGLDLLKTTDLNVAEIAYQVGFEDPNYFSRCFTHEFGTTPSETRK